MVSRNALAKMVEGTLLSPTATRREITAFCERAFDFHLASVCVFPYWARTSAEVLNGSDVKICVPIGLPFGTCSTQVKLLEAKNALNAGANELDVVINLGALKSRDIIGVEKDLEEIVKMAKLAGITGSRKAVLTNVVLEVPYLSEEEVETACQIAVASGAELIKTCSGLIPCHPSPKEVRVLKRRLGKDIGLKVGGDVQTVSEVVELINAGATRVGTTYCCQIIESAPPDPDET